MSVLDVDEERPRQSVAVIGDRIEAWRDAAELHTLDLVLVLEQERIAEDSKCDRVGFDPLHDEVVVLTGLDEGTVLTHGRALLLDEFFESVLLQLTLLLLVILKRLAALMHGKLDEGVARA
jgi:hypothetical protein